MTGNLFGLAKKFVWAFFHKMIQKNPNELLANPIQRLGVEGVVGGGRPQVTFQLRV